MEIDFRVRADKNMKFLLAFGSAECDGMSIVGRGLKLIWVKKCSQNSIEINHFFVDYYCCDKKNEFLVCFCFDFFFSSKIYKCQNERMQRSKLSDPYGE